MLSGARHLLLLRFCVFSFEYKLLLRLFGKFNGFYKYILSIFFCFSRQEGTAKMVRIRCFFCNLYMYTSWHLSNVFYKNKVVCKNVFKVVAARTFVCNSGKLFKRCSVLCRRYRDFMKDCPSGELKQEVVWNQIFVVNFQNMSLKSTWESIFWKKILNMPLSLKVVETSSAILDTFIANFPWSMKHILPYKVILNFDKDTEGNIVWHIFSTLKCCARLSMKCRKWVIYLSY